MTIRDLAAQMGLAKEELEAKLRAAGLSTDGPETRIDPDRVQELLRKAAGDRELPRGLMLFPPGTSPERRRRRMVFVGIFVLVSAGLLWPVYPRFAAARPLIFGLPLSLAWVLAMLAVGFGALLWLYFGDRREEE